MQSDRNKKVECKLRNQGKVNKLISHVKNIAKTLESKRISKAL